MNWNRIIRQTHRWLSIIFFVTVGVATYAAVTGQDESSGLFYLPLPPLFLLMATGLYLFLLPYVARWRGSST